MMHQSCSKGSEYSFNLPVLIFYEIAQNVLECGSKKSNADQTMSLFLSNKLGKRRHGFEYGALEVKNHLECLMLSDIVSTSMIMSTSTSLFHFHLLLSWF